ncbi:MAG TPA: pyridoxal phosphate-dependent aminotransferase [Candidatus Lustribacter sp.]|nr:pyridoxal phosphate-dependent aminotransferase [Candidatus Lustribacter sp.]
MNPTLAHIEPSQIRALAAKKRPTSIDLGLGEPTLFPQQRFIDAAARETAERGMKYTLNPGDLELRALIARHYGYPGMADGRNVCITGGSQEAMYVAIKTLLDPARDEVLIVEPAYPAYAKIAQLEGIAVRSVGMTERNGFGYDPEAIVAALRPATRLIIIGSPSNPTGRVIGRAAAQQLADALLARGGEPVWILDDELYRELTYVDDAGSLAGVYPYTIAINGLSKSNALTGLRIGWTIAPAPLCDELIKVHAWIVTAANTFGQRVATHIFTEPGALSEQAAWYRTQRAAVLSALRDSGLTFIEPDGAFYACVKLPSGTDSLAAAYRLVDERDVVTIPGSIFGATLEGWLRLSWVAPIDAFREGLARIASAALV